MKIAISGKGGVGKTLLAALLSQEFNRNGYSVLAIDADPDTNLASTLGFQHPDEIIPISEMKELIEERTGSEPGKPGSMFKLNPRVDDIPEKFAHIHNGIRLMIMGKMKKGGGGCYCSENALLQSLMAHLLVNSKEVVILDMAAGIEHLGRATAKAVDEFIVVVEPGRKSLDTAQRIKKLAQDIGVTNIVAIGNKIRNDTDKYFVTSNLPDFKFLGFIPYDISVVDAEVSNSLTVNSSQRISREIELIYQQIINSSFTSTNKS